MQCPRCQAENREGLRFCEDCGTRLVTGCPSCGAEVTPGKRFCGSCGAAVAGAPSASAGRFASPQAYTPKHLADRILTSGVALEGERKQVTVLFADLKGSMELLADRDPEEARKILDPVLESMMEAVHRFEGTVNQVMGDGIMALFGAPLAHEDHAVRACYAALRMQETVRSYADEVHRREGMPIQIRVGLNSGEVVVRSIGSDLRMDYTAVGQTTHLAARMEQMAVPGSILVSAATLNLVEGYVTVKALGVRNVKGLPEPVEVYELSGAAAARTRLQASAARGLTRFVGRSAEMEQLVEALALARDGHGQVVAVVGEPGVGKSRLFWELVHSHQTGGWLVLEASSVSYGKATPYLPVIDLLKRYFKLGDRDGHRESREKVTGKLLTLDEALPALPAFLELLNISVDDAAWLSLEPALRRQRMLQAARHLLLRESRVQPLVIVFEDLHWIDSETQAFLNGLVESLTGARLLLLVNYRPEYGHGWGGKTYYRQLRVHPLPPESAGELLDALVGDDVTLEPLKPVLMRQAEGTPLFLEETVRALVETGALRGDRGRYRLVKELRTVEIPPTVQAILAARIDRLSPEDKQLLQASSVIGKDVPFTLLQAISDASDEVVKSGLARLQAAEFLYETSLFPDLEFTFKHALTHDVAYGSLLQGRRRELHARVAGAMERLYADRRADYVERLADHAFRGESWEQAVDYLRDAGAKAVARAPTVREAVGHFERALVALTHLPTSPTHVEAGIDIRLDLRNCLYLVGEHARTLDHLRAARELAAPTGDSTRLTRVAGYLATTFVFLGQHAQALEEATRARELASSARHPELEIEMQQRAAQVHVARGEFADGTRLLNDVIRIVDSGGPAPRLFGQILTSVQARSSLAIALSEQGDFATAIRAGERALAEAEREGHRYSQGVALASRGSVYLRQGEFEAAQPLLERALELSRELELSLIRAGVTTHLGLVYVHRGRVEAGLALLEEMRERRLALGGPARVFLAEGYLVARRPLEAKTLALRAAEEARQRNEPAVVARASVVIADAAALEPAAASEALDAYRDASATAERLGMRPLLAHCHLGLGRLYRRTGKRQEAQEHLTTATTMYREMQMRYWLEQAAADMAGPH